MTEKFYDFDPAEMLDSDEAIEVFLTEAMGTSDAKFVVSTLGVVARTKGMSKSSIHQDQISRLCSLHERASSIR